ncbi:zinc ABC transporter ATP-binding protein AztA [Nocardia shimofusensis]|uniref:zinc ABC transporter ATP-binding protein AztA n=1 Tax=Nocardia shimofusensis TaxID=228596 RepID=UPI000ADEF3E2|nr:zinc ABC transporter ATP-binding protein AztA [Nocardia shimofusensis]
MTAGVRIDGLTAGYRGRIALREITATIPAGAVTAVLGHNGSGKSTLLAALAGLLRPIAGRIDRGGHTRTAFVVQHSAVSATLPITVGQTVAMGRWAHLGHWRRSRRQDTTVVADCLRRMDLTGLAHRRLDTLSGGQRQRTLIAQALAQQADLLLLDEPTANLDARSRRVIAGLLTETAATGVTVVHATHRSDEARAADHHLVLDDGRLLPHALPGEQPSGHDELSFDRNATAAQSLGLP